MNLRKYTRSKKEKKMNQNNDNSNLIRSEALRTAKQFKTAWVDLGRTLYEVHKNKLYKDWGYSNFDAYTAKEIGIRKQTSIKLLRSYFFLEDNEPNYTKPDFLNERKTNEVPEYETVDVLRQAKNKNILEPEDYQSLRSSVFNKGHDMTQVKKGLTALIKERKQIDPELERHNQRLVSLKRLVAILKSIKQEMSFKNILREDTLQTVEKLISSIEEEMPELT